MIRRAGLALLVVLAVAVLFLGLAPQGRAMVKAALFISQVVPAVPAQTWFQPEPVRIQVQVPTPEGPRDADLYRPPGDGPYVAAVLFLGVAPAGGDDPRVVDLARGLARTGMVTLIYWSPEKMDKRIHPPDTQNLVSAFQYLRSQPFVDPDRVGFAGFCVGASFVLVAAAQEEVRHEVAFVNVSGPYFRLYDLAMAIGTGTRFHGDQRVPWTVNSLTREVATKLLLESLHSAPEVERIQATLAQGLELAPGQVSSQGHAVMRILAGGTVEQVDAAMEGLPAELLAMMEEVSPERYVSQILAPVFIMHDRDDDLVPPEESRRMAAALAEHQDVRYTEFSLFQHVTPTRPLSLWDLTQELNKLFWHMYAIMRLTT
jgi:acetyl esterase/lipase